MALSNVPSAARLAWLSTLVSAADGEGIEARDIVDRVRRLRDACGFSTSASLRDEVDEEVEREGGNTRLALGGRGRDQTRFGEKLLDLFSLSQQANKNYGEKSSR